MTAWKRGTKPPGWFPRQCEVCLIGKKDNWQIIQAATDWQTMPTSLEKDEFEVATDLYFIEVVKR